MEKSNMGDRLQQLVWALPPRCQAIAEGCSDDLHFRTASSRFFSQYVRSWAREVREVGPWPMLRRFLRLRSYHAQLIAHTLFGRWRRKHQT
jgi:hypothetical protein